MDSYGGETFLHKNTTLLPFCVMYQRLRRKIIFPTSCGVQPPFALRIGPLLLNENLIIINQTTELHKIPNILQL